MCPMWSYQPPWDQMLQEDQAKLQAPPPPLTECQDQSPKHENAIFDALCTATSLNQTWGRCMIHLDHHLYNHLNDPCVWQTS